MAKINFIGKGVAFPFRLANTGGLKRTVGISVAEEIKLINSSLKFILSVQVGERPMRRDFGCQLRSLVFEPNDPSLDTRIDFIIRTAIDRWEKRIQVNGLRIDRSQFKDGRLILDITYTIIQSNVIGNLVYPFYLNDPEGNAINNRDVNFVF